MLPHSNNIKIVGKEPISFKFEIQTWVCEYDTLSIFFASLNFASLHLPMLVDPGVLLASNYEAG